MAYKCRPSIANGFSDQSLLCFVRMSFDRIQMTCCKGKRGVRGGINNSCMIFRFRYLGTWVLISGRIRVLVFWYHWTAV